MTPSLPHPHPERRPPRLDWAAVEPPSRPFLFVNPRSGGGTATRARLAERARERGIEVAELGPGDDLAAMAEDAVARGADVLGMAGGDGSLAVVATVADVHRLPFICVPAGTRNHFARDLGLDPGAPASVLDAFSDGAEGRIDLAEVNGRVFLNNVSLGVYGDAVARAEYRDAKLRTLLETARAGIGPAAKVPELRFVDDRGREHANPALVLVSNNPYAFDPRAAHRGRPTLSSGLLGIITIDAERSGRAPPGPPQPRAWSASRMEIEADTSLHAGFDGEAVELAPPLRFSIRQGALRVRIPRAAALDGGDGQRSE